MLSVYTAQSILLSLGMAFTGYWAYQAFDAPPIKLGDGPALPRYMTQPGQYRLGVIAFVGTCLIIYALIAYYHRELLPLVGAFDPELQHTIESSMNNGSLPYPLVVIFSAAIFVSLLKIEQDWNPIFLLRRVVHGWVSIPQIANALMVMIRDELVVPTEMRAIVARESTTPNVTVGDFDKDRRSVDRRWAELCYIRFWLERHRAQGSHFSFFNEPSFAWDKLQADYDRIRDRVAPLKQGTLTDANIIEDIAARVDALRRDYCRLAACFLVFKNETQKDALRDAEQFGAKISTPERANPLRYLVLFVVSILIAIYLGVSLSATAWDLLHPDPATLDPDNSDVAIRWMYYALANYGMPILAVLLLRYLGWRSDPSQPNSYLISYATIWLVALGVAVVCLAIAQIAAGVITIDGFGQQLIKNVKWGISPAVVAIYIAYHVDRQIDPLLPDLGSSEHWRLPQRLMSCVFFALLVTAFSALPTLAITVSRPPWPVGKLQIVILGTTYLIGLIMAVVGEFLLVKPSPERSTGAGAQPAAGNPSAESGRPWRSAITASLAAILLAGLAAFYNHARAVAVVPEWAFDNKPVYLGRRVPLAWTYQPATPGAAVNYEIESGTNGAFSPLLCTDTEHHSIDRINATREFRVRAVTDCRSRTQLSDWSPAIAVTQYDSIAQRIKSRGQADIFVSTSQDQDIFKWGDQGFDIDLAKLIIGDLSRRFGREVKLVQTAVPWEKLLAAASDGSADFAISSITKTAQREKQFSIQFSDSYYCTTHALIYRNGTPEAGTLDMLKGGLVGVQRATTNAELVERLAAAGLFRFETFDTTEDLQDALVASRIDLAVTDTSFAQSAQLDMRLDNGVDRLGFKEFGPDDLTQMPGAQTQHYAIAVHKGEIDLLDAINTTLAKAKEDGRLASLFKTAAENYETFKRYPPGSRSLGPRPWECFFSQTSDSGASSSRN